MSRGRRGRERRPHALFEAHAPVVRSAETCISRSADDASFTWSSDPCTSIATSTPFGAIRGGGASKQVSRSGKPGESQEEPAPGSESTDVARLAACHRFRKGEGVAGQKRKGVTALVPARNMRAPGQVPVRRSSCRNRQATSGPKYTRQTRTKKCGQGRANGGLGLRFRRRSHVGERVERNDESRARIESDHNGSRSGRGPG